MVTLFGNTRREKVNNTTLTAIVHAFTTSIGILYIANNKSLYVSSICIHLYYLSRMKYQEIYACNGRVHKVYQTQLQPPKSVSVSAQLFPGSERATIIGQGSCID